MESTTRVSGLSVPYDIDASLALGLLREFRGQGISVTDEEADTLNLVFSEIEEPLGDLVLSPDPDHDGWQIMRGPCIFRRYHRALAAGGCRIYEDRPASCAIFTCRLILELRRVGS